MTGAPVGRADEPVTPVDQHPGRLGLVRRVDPRRHDGLGARSPAFGEAAQHPRAVTDVELGDERGREWQRRGLAERRRDRDGAGPDDCGVGRERRQRPGAHAPAGERNGDRQQRAVREERGRDEIRR